MALAIDAGASPGADRTGYDLPPVANGQWRVETLDGPAANTAGLVSVMLTSAAPVPETGSARLMAAGLGALAVLRRRRRG